MVKTSPVVRDAESVDPNSRFVTERVKDLMQEVQRYANDMSEWLIVNSEWWIRRYSLHERITDDPWPGASTMHLPMSDVYIEQAKPFYMNALFGGPRVATMTPLNTLAVENEHAASMMMEHILRGQGRHAMPDFPMQVAYALDSMSWSGQGVFKSYYSYRTRAATETLRRDDLPGILSRLIIKPDMSDEDRAETLARVGEQALNPPELVAFFGEAVNPMTREIFRRHENRIKREVMRLFDLDEDERLDVVACEDIMEYLRSGTKEYSVAIMRRNVIEDVPRLVNVPIQDLILPPDALCDFSRCDVVAERVRVSEQEALERAKDEVWSDKAVEVLLNQPHASFSPDGGEILTFEQNQRMQNYGPSQFRDTFEYWQIYSHEDLSGRGVKELAVTEVVPRTGAVLRRAPHAADHGQIPYSTITFESNAPQFRSARGIPEKIRDIEEHASAWHRHMENGMQVTSSPSLAVSEQAAPAFEDVRWIPGLILPVPDPQRDVAPIPLAPVQIQVERMLGFLQLWPERLVGGFDTQGLAEQDAPERRTATEVSVIDSTRARSTSMRGILFAHQMRRALQQVWSLWKQYGPTEAFIQITGEKPTSVTQAQTQGAFGVAPYVAIGTMDPSFRIQQKAQRLQEAIQLKPLVESDPRYQLNLGEAVLDKWREEDPIAASRLIRERSPEEQQAIREQIQAQIQQAEQIEELAQKALANAPMSEVDAERFLRELSRRMPHGSLQQILQEAEAVRAQGREAGVA